MMDLKSMAEEIGRIDSAANRLLELAQDFPSVSKNAARILASVRMLKINVSDLLALSDADAPDWDHPRP